MKRYRLLDSFAWQALGASAVALTLALIVQFNGLNEDVPTRGWVILWVTVAGFWGITLRYLQLRWLWLRRIAYTTRHGVTVIDDGGVVPSEAEVEIETANTLAAWLKVPSEVTAADVLEKGLVVWVRKAPFQLHGKGKKYMGFAKPFSRQVAVGMDGRPMDETALAHEIGHILALHMTGDGSEKRLEELHSAYGVPY